MCLQEKRNKEFISHGPVNNSSFESMLLSKALTERFTSHTCFLQKCLTGRNDAEMMFIFKSSKQNFTETSESSVKTKQIFWRGSWPCLTFVRYSTGDVKLGCSPWDCADRLDLVRCQSADWCIHMLEFVLSSLQHSYLKRRSPPHAHWFGCRRAPTCYVSVE